MWVRQGAEAAAARQMHAAGRAHAEVALQPWLLEEVPHTQLTMSSSTPESSAEAAAWALSAVHATMGMRCRQSSCSNRRSSSAICRCTRSCESVNEGAWEAKGHAQPRAALQTHIPARPPWHPAAAHLPAVQHWHLQVQQYAGHIFVALRQHIQRHLPILCLHHLEAQLRCARGWARGRGANRVRTAERPPTPWFAPNVMSFTLKQLLQHLLDCMQQGSATRGPVFPAKNARYAQSHSGARLRPQAHCPPQGFHATSVSTRTLTSMRPMIRRLRLWSSTCK